MGSSIKLSHTVSGKSCTAAVKLRQWQKHRGRARYRTPGFESHERRDLLVGSDSIRLDVILTASSSPASLVDVNGTLFFSASGPSGRLWKSDGTDAGTVRVKDVAPSRLTNVNGTLFFFASGQLLFKRLHRRRYNSREGYVVDRRKLKPCRSC